MTLRNPILILTSLLLSIPLSPDALSQEPTSSHKKNKAAMLVLDASGSMWGQIDGKAKITIAKTAVSEIITNWDHETPLGLIAYGHNHKADCRDIELLQPIGKVNQKKFLHTVNNLKPKGKTPLTASVQQAAAELNYRKNKATILLISDGKETCQLDPCAVGRDLEKKGIDFTTHVISFDVPESETAGLRCLAHETGGIYLEAKNAKELQGALQEASTIITDKEAIKISDALVSAPAEIVAGAAFQVEWKGPKNKLDILVIKSTDHKKSFDYQYIGHEDRQSPSTLTAPEKEGLYEVHYLLNDRRSLAKTSIKVIPATATVKVANTITAGSAFPVTWSGPQNKFDNVTVYDTTKNKQLNYEYIYREKDHTPTLLTAPEKPGEYEVRYYTYGKKTLAKQLITVIKAGATINAQKDVIAGSTFSVTWSGPQNKFDNVTVYDTAKNKQLNYEYIYREKDHSPTLLTAPEKPGEYEVRYYTYGKKTLAKQAFTVKPAHASIDAPKEVVAGSAFSVTWTGPKNKFDNITVFDTKKNKRHNYEYVHHKNSSSPTFLIAPEKLGNYEARYYTYAKNTLAKQRFIVIKANATVSAPEEITAGSEFNVNWTGPKNKFDVVTVFDVKKNKKLDSEYVHRDNSQSPTILKAPKKAGLYEVRYYTRGKNTLASQKIKVVEK